ncbi:MAG: hypothetical protein ACRCZK_05415 [Oscillospiraceae bacterium]
MNKLKLSNLIFLISFLVMISLPFMFTNTVKDKRTKTENRVLNQFPIVFGSNGKLQKNSISHFERWINDNIGFRENAIRLATTTYYRLFNEMGTKITLKGKDDWMFYYTDKILEDYQNINLPDNDTVKIYADKYLKSYEYSKSKGIPYVGFLALDKKTIYPENYPDSIKKTPNISRRELLENYINENSDMPFVNPYDRLIKAKDNYTVYSPRIDTSHWNIMGAFIGYKMLMEEVSKHLPDVNLVTEDDFNIEEIETTSKFMDTLTISEIDYDFESKTYENIYFDTSFKVNNVKDKRNFRVINELNKDLPKALIMGDSYFYMNSMMLKFLGQSFSEVIFINNQNIDKSEEYIDMFNPDIVITEYVERVMFRNP